MPRTAARTRTRAGCAAGSTWVPGSCITPESCSSTSPRPASPLRRGPRCGITRDEAFEQSRNRALEIARTVSGVSRASIFDEGVSAYTADGGATLLEVLRRLDAEKVPVHQVALAHPTLDEVFLQHTGRQMRVEEVKPMSRSFGRRRR